MIAAHSIAPPSAHPFLRPFSPRHDLSRSADLIELAFDDMLDDEGQAYLRQVRSAAQNPIYLAWAETSGERLGMPLSGYVWEERGELVGNLSLIPFYIQGKRCYLIANVAVHPAHRRKGIARALTIAGLEHAFKRGAPAAWLHVREENEAAVALYRSLGFQERARRVTYRLGAGEAASLPPGELTPLEWTTEEVRVVSRRDQDWPSQAQWMEAAYPAEVRWHSTLVIRHLRPGLFGAIQRMMQDVRVRQWSALRHGELLGVVAWRSSYGFSDDLYLALGSGTEGLAAYHLMSWLRKLPHRRRLLTLDYPAGQAEAAIRAAGFRKGQTLIWMSRNTA